MASNDVVLGAALRSNLLTLQNTQRSIDSTQLRLATGKKVNSALDSPQNFFTSQSLNNRASDLTRLLDGIGQSIKTIEAADKGVTALTKLVEQADSIVSSARDELAGATGSSRMLGNVDLRNVTDIVALTGATAATDRIVVTTTADDGTQISENIFLNTGDTAYTLAAKITDQFADNRAGEITAQINSTTGFLEIQSKGGRTFKIGDGAVLAAAAGIGAAGYNALGIGRYFETEVRGAAANLFVNATVVAGNTASTISLYEGSGNLVDAGDLVVGAALTDASGTSVLSGLVAGDSFNFTVNTASASIPSGAIALTATTSFQDIVDQINLTAAVKPYISAKFDSDSGQIQITSKSGSVENIKITLTNNATVSNRVFDVGFGDSTGNLAPISTATAPLVASQLGEQVISFNSSTETLSKLADDYNTLRGQIDDLVKDANYRGVNLLRGDNLTTFFNEDNTSKLVTTGATFTADGLGLAKADFSTSTAIESTASKTRSALNEVRSFGSSLANNLSIIQTRQTFTQETINTLKAGASELTDADLNEEGAKLLALQTAQQLGVTALSLASQSQQSVLRLF